MNRDVYRTQDLQAMAKVLSSRFRGEIWAQGPQSISTQEDRFSVSILGTGSGRFTAFGRRLIWVLRRCLRLREVENARFVIGSYDPFREGLLTWFASILLSAPYWIELNGCFADDNNYRDRPTEPPNSRKKWLMKQVAQLTTSNASVIKTLFPEQSKEFLPSVAPAKTIVFPDFVDLTGFRPIEEQNIVLFLGFPFFLKGVDILLTSFQAIAGQFPDWRLLLVGHELQAHSANWLPHPQIEVRKAVFRDQIPDILGRCSILVLPSRSEAMGRVLIEAAACGKARIASRVGGTYTVVSDLVDGLLVEPANVSQLSEALRVLMANAQLRRQLGEAAMRRVDTEFSSSNWLERMQELVERCLSSGSYKRDAYDEFESKDSNSC